MSENETVAPLLFKQIEGLRGYMALWVALGHGFQLAGYLSLPGPFNLILMNGAAVQVFMIISGFVIAHLLLKKDEGYGPYVVRRFFRLYPVFLLCCLIGYLVFPTWVRVVEMVPWQDAAGWSAYVGSVKTIAFQTAENTLPHAAAHALMLHGAVPEEILPRAGATFLPAAWSISLEWQFYLVAPALVLLLVSPKWTAIGLLASAGVALASAAGVFGSFEYGAFLGQSIGYFFLGIASRWLFPALKSVDGKWVAPLGMAAVGAMTAIELSIPLVIWLAFYMALLWHERAPLLSRIFNLLTASAMPLLLGRISYSLYLLHRPVQVVLAYAALQLVLVDRPAMVAVQLAAVAITIPLAYVSYRYVEKTGMTLGKSLADKLATVTLARKSA